jgi:hypothetical protein
MRLMHGVALSLLWLPDPLLKESEPPVFPLELFVLPSPAASAVAEPSARSSAIAVALVRFMVLTFQPC